MSSRPARPRVDWRSVDGILLFDKGIGLSSNQALQTVRRLYRAEKAGHTGSLDPLASGMLPLCFGQATKVAGLLLDCDKTYEATLLMGVRTSTGDAEGAVIDTRNVPAGVAERIIDVLSTFRGQQTQVPPMYSALKHQGETLYSLARRGIEVARAPRPITIHSIELVGIVGPAVSFRVSCSKGTYIRTLGEDIATALGTVGHLTSLRRTAVGSFAGRQVHALSELELLRGDDAILDSLLLPVDTALEGLDPVYLNVDDDAKFRHGQVVYSAQPVAARQGADVRVYGWQGDFIGIGRLSDGLHPARLMSPARVGKA
jgi:tRNA pseudouridine55 synthase